VDRGVRVKGETFDSGESPMMVMMEAEGSQGRSRRSGR
jgi:hypothetical protein